MGVLRFGLPISLLATLLRILTERPFHPSHALLHIVVNPIAGVVGGYIAGRVVWDLLVER